MVRPSAPRCSLERVELQVTGAIGLRFRQTAAAVRTLAALAQLVLDGGVTLVLGAGVTGNAERDGGLSDRLFALRGVQSVDDGLERQDQAERAAVKQWHCAETLVPARRLFILGVDSQRHPADLRGHGQRPRARCQQQIAAKPLTLQWQRYGQTGKPVNGDLVAPSLLVRKSGTFAKAIEAGLME